MSLTGNFIPGSGSVNRKRQRQIMNRYSNEIQRLQSKMVSGNPDYFCECFQEKLDSNKSSYRDSEEPRNIRISRLVTSPLGGITEFGQGYIEPVVLPLRNKF